jgi:hypothetical protein
MQAQKPPKPVQLQAGSHLILESLHMQCHGINTASSQTGKCHKIAHSLQQKPQRINQRLPAMKAIDDRTIPT